MAIIKKLDSGEKMANVARAYGMDRSTMEAIQKGKDCTSEHVKSSILHLLCLIFFSLLYAYI